jgi:predicted HTH transcriptional regulator
LGLSFDSIRNCEVNKEFDVMIAIDSFLNSEGGILIIGVADDKTIVGLKGDYSILLGDRKNSNGFENKLRNLIQTKFFKTSLVGGLIKVKFHRHELSDCEICVIEVGKSHVPIFSYNEDQRQHFFVRQGNRTNKLEGIELSDYIKRHFCNKITDCISNE